MIDLTQQLEHYRSPVVRDLVWALLSPSLINSNNANHNPSPRWFVEAYRLIEPHLQSLERDDGTLVEYLNTHSQHRLGLYFERLWSYWLQHNGRYQMLAQNLQVIKDNQTLGEFDLIVHDTAADQIEHWELAVKFYLGISPLWETNHWFGTHTKDRLDLKHCHLVDKQLLLSETHPGRQTCAQHGWQIQQRRLLCKGRLYYPWSTFTDHIPELPPCIDPPHLKGYWLTQTAFRTQSTLQAGAKYLWLDKTEWLVHKSRPTQTTEDITRILEQQLHPHPVQLWIDGWLPQPIRLFVVPDQWETAALGTLSHQ